MGEDFEMRILPANVGGVAGDFDGKRIIDTFADNVAKLVGGNEGFARLFDLHLFIAVSDGHFQIGRGDDQGIVLRPSSFSIAKPAWACERRRRCRSGSSFEQRTPIAVHFHA